MQLRSTQLLFTVLVLVGLLAPSAEAQRIGRKFRPFPAHGIEFKPLDAMSDVPANDRLKDLGVIGQFDVEKAVQVKLDNGERTTYSPSCKVVRLDPPKATSGDDPLEKSSARTLEDVVQDLFGGLGELDLETAEVSDFKGTKGLAIQRYELLEDHPTGGGSLPLVIDVYVFQMEDFKAILSWDYPADKKLRRKWASAVEKSMRSLRPMRRGADETEFAEVDSESSYEDLLAYHTNDVEQTPGWRLVETPSKQYLIKTNAEKKKDGDIKLVIQRIEASRELYEEDFPPATPITSVSVIRLCATRADFNTYGQTGGGVAGYFNPGSEELVLFFGTDGKEGTLAVMAHEGFHQYCHFLFNRSEAHRWFDEGHGDYYGAWKMKGRKLVRDEDMKGGLARLPEIKKMFKEGTIAPLSDHIRYSHQEWQTQGPSNVSCYAQSFSLIYYLREGSRGKVKRKYWDKQYADIIPNYLATLDAGYREAYAAIVDEAEEGIAQLEADPDASQSLLANLRARAKSPWDYLGPAAKQAIWDRAMEASWGQIDEAELEEQWLEYIDEVL